MAAVRSGWMVRWLDFWGRRVHIYVGLYFTIAVWFFALSGLALNRPEWIFGKDGPAKTETKREVSFRSTGELDGDALAANLASQLGLIGERERFWLNKEKNTFWFRVTHPGIVTDVDADLTGLKATVRVTDWGPGITAFSLHTFTGVGPWRDRGRGTALARDWAATYLWVWSMDAVCIGLLYMVASGLYMWLRQSDKRIPGAVALIVGIAGCAYFLTGM